MWSKVLLNALDVLLLYIARTTWSRIVDSKGSSEHREHKVSHSEGFDRHLEVLVRLGFKRMTLALLIAEGRRMVLV